jgi:hypothetical protein
VLFSPVKAVEGSAIGTVYLLERASDGAQVSVEVAGRGVGASAWRGHGGDLQRDRHGVILSVAGEALAFVPNAWAVRCCTTNAVNMKYNPLSRFAASPFSFALRATGRVTMPAGRCGP